MKTLVAMLLMTSAAAANPLVVDESSADSKLLTIVADSTNDPFAAQFRKLHDSGGAVCGEVNAKNAFGGYNGFKLFFIDKKSHVVNISGANYAPGEFFLLHTQAC